MDVRLSAEQQALRDSAARLVDRLGPHSVGQLADAERAGKLDAAVTASGWRELRVVGGGGAPLASGVEAAIVAEELGRGLADVSFVGPTLASELRRLAAVPPGDAIETVALTADLSSLACAAEGETTTSVAIDVQGSSGALLCAGGPGGPGGPNGPGGDGGPGGGSGPGGWLLVETALRAPPTGVDLTRPSMALDPPLAVSPVEQGRSLQPDDLTRWTALGLSLACADLVGTMAGAVQLASAYAAGRRQYGSAIGSFQAIQHLLADAHVMTEGARSATLHAAWAVDALAAGDALSAAAVAKAYSARAARQVCETAIQVHGGIGNTWECLAHVYLRRALVSCDLLGGTGPSLARVLRHRGIGGGDGLS